MIIYLSNRPTKRMVRVTVRHERQTLYRALHAYEDVHDVVRAHPGAHIHIEVRRRFSRQQMQAMRVTPTPHIHAAAHQLALAAEHAVSERHRAVILDAARIVETLIETHDASSYDGRDGSDMTTRSDGGTE